MQINLPHNVDSCPILVTSLEENATSLLGEYLLFLVLVIGYLEIRTAHIHDTLVIH